MDPNDIFREMFSQMGHDMPPGFEHIFNGGGVRMSFGGPMGGFQTFNMGGPGVRVHNMGGNPFSFFGGRQQQRNREPLPEPTLM